MNILNQLSAEESKEYKLVIGTATKEYLQKHPETKSLILPMLKSIFRNIDFNSEIPF